MAYLPSNNWWLNGPKNPQGGGCGGACGETGMGQLLATVANTATQGTCADGSMAIAAGFGVSSCDDGSTPLCPTGTVWNASSGMCQPTSSTLTLCPIGQVCSWIPGIPNNYIYIGGAVLLGALLLGVTKK